MRILIIAATALEVKNFTQSTPEVGKPICVYFEINHSVDILITGIGAVPTAFYLARFADKYDFILNVGIAGSYSEKLRIGEVVIIIQDAFGDYGIDDNSRFVPLKDSGIKDVSLSRSNHPMINHWVDKGIISSKLSKVNGITLATASGSADVINRVINTWNPDVETMESAAVFYSCLNMNKPFLCIRAVSNLVEPRNKQNWKINEALLNLNAETLNLIKSIDVIG